MVKHIVFFKLKPSAEGGTRDENARKLKGMVESLRGKIPGLLKAEVGIDFDRSDAAWDIALVAELTDRAALAAYQKHPEHVAVAQFLGKVRESRAVVDFETDGL